MIAVAGRVSVTERKRSSAREVPLLSAPTDNALCAQKLVAARLPEEIWQAGLPLVLAPHTTVGSTATGHARPGASSQPAGSVVVNRKVPGSAGSGASS